MKSQKLLAYFTLSLLLTACGGGGGGSSLDLRSDDPSPIPTPAPAPTPTGIKTTGHIMQYSADTGYLKNSRQYSDSSTENLNSFVIDNKEVKIIVPQGITAGEALNINGQITSGTKYKDSVFGSMQKDGSVYIYQKGIITPAANIPTTGTAVYQGTAVIAQRGQYSNVLIEQGKVNLNVDFGAKSVNGDIKYNNVPTQESIVIAATIDGNKFQGDSMRGGDTLTTRGQFNGNQAQEITGSITSKTDHNFNTVFGAIKQ